jgi:hypothetical protein
VSLLFFLLSLSILFLILKFRVHVHVNIETNKRSRSSNNRAERCDAASGCGVPRLVTREQPGASQRPAKNAGNQAESHPALGPRPYEADIVSALLNLGSKPAEARAAAKRALDQGPGEFTELLKRAIQEAA